MAQVKMSADEVLRPQTITCGKCGGEAEAIPPDVCYCECSSPAWLRDFAYFRMNLDRVKAGLAEIEVSHRPRR